MISTEILVHNTPDGFAADVTEWIENQELCTVQDEIEHIGYRHFKITVTPNWDDQHREFLQFTSALIDFLEELECQI